MVSSFNTDYVCFYPPAGRRQKEKPQIELGEGIGDIKQGKPKLRGHKRSPLGGDAQPVFRASPVQYPHTLPVHTPVLHPCL